jgi:membrane-associated phospholipid phosphatase
MKNASVKLAQAIEDCLFPSNAAIMASIAIITYYFLKNSPFTSNHIIVFLSVLITYLFARRYLNGRMRSETRMFTYPALAGLFVFTVLALILPLEKTFLLAWISTIILIIIVHAVRDRWKISGHAMTISAMAFILSSIDPVFLSSFVLLPFVMWSRVKLRRHSYSQVVAGSVVGIAVPWIVSGIIFGLS